jgi:hypothetical protein
MKLLNEAGAKVYFCLLFLSARSASEGACASACGGVAVPKQRVSICPRS